MLISIKSFSGTIPRIGERLLDANQAAIARDAKFWSGELRPLQEDRAVLKLSTASTYQTLWKYDHPTHGDIWFRNAEQLSILKGPVFNDTKNRAYVTGLDVPRVFDADLITDTAVSLTTANTYPLAVPKPSQKATMAVSGTSGGQEEARAYLYTYARQWDTEKFDEGAPSSPAETSEGEVTVTVGNDQTVTLSGIKDLIREDINYITVYRSSAGATEASYNKVIKFNLADARAGTVDNVTYNSTAEEFTFVDEVLTQDLSSALVSLDWDAPLDELTGIVSLNNGILAGYVGNDLYLSAAYQPHAWPAKYRHTFDYPITGLGHFGNTVVVLTEAYPALINVPTPDVATMTPINEVAPCISKRSIVNAGDAVYYASTNGILRVSSAGVQLATQQLYSKEEWQELRPESMIAALYESRYYGVYTLDTGQSAAIMVDFAEANAGVSTLSGKYDAFYVDPDENNLFYIKRDVTGTPYVWQAEGDTIAHKTYTWRSKKFISPQGPVSLSAARVLGELPYLDPNINLEQAIKENNQIFLEQALAGAFNENLINQFSVNGDSLTNIYAKYITTDTVSFKLYVDRVLVFEKEVGYNKPFRLPAGIRGMEFQCEIAGSINVFQTDMATSMSELAG